MNPIINRLGPYHLAEKAKLFPERDDVIDASIGEPKFEPRPFVLEQLAESVKSQGNKYPPTKAKKELDQSFMEYFSRNHQVDLDGDEVQVLLGSGEGLYSIPFVAASPDRPHAIIPDPSYQVYQNAALMAGLHPIPAILSPEYGFEISFKHSSEMTRDSAAVMYINYPNNPTGVAASEEFLKKAHSEAQKHGFLLVSDECYLDLASEPQKSILQVAKEEGNDKLENVVAFHSLSKRSSLPGIRSGYMAGDKRVIEAYKKLRLNERKTMPGFIQDASIVAWSDDEYVFDARMKYEENMSLFREHAPDVRMVEPGMGFYAFMKTKGHGDFTEKSKTFAAELYDATGVKTLPGVFMQHGNNPMMDTYVRVALVHDAETTKDMAQRINTYMVN